MTRIFFYNEQIPVIFDKFNRGR
ncbi:uncharacterized protein METZ01_LOCUS393273 [marine metagenome]|uniref:Uncharacterized protein n=1 Tax=marine metagenome TaxID=408172 RepID=A0A382V1S2_9ZZZZ